MAGSGMQVRASARSPNRFLKTILPVIPIPPWRERNLHFFLLRDLRGHMC